MKATQLIQLGLRANWRQVALLVAINAFFGGVVGVERSTLAPLAENDFHLASSAAILSFLISFGLVKAASNFIAGGLADRFGRRTVLLAGWMAALPVPLLIILAPSWGWVVFANVLLGLNQGLAWSTTVNMKIDLVGPRRRGFALGVNEASGYLALSAAAAVAGFLAASYGIRPAPYLLAEGLAVIGLLLSLFARETAGHVELNPAARCPHDRWASSCSTSASTTGRCPARAKPAWSTTSTTEWPGRCCHSSLQLTGSGSAKSDSWPAPTLRSGAPDNWAPG